MSDTTKPSDILSHIIATFLTPLFLGGGSANSDTALARQLAIGVLNTCQFRDGMELLLCAQAIGFSLISLGSMALSIADGLSSSMILRLRGNANACTRSAELNRRALAAARTEAEQDERRQAELDRCARFDAVYPDEQMLAEVAETQRMAAEATARLRDSQGRMELVKAMQEMQQDCDRRLAAEVAETGAPRDIAPVAARAATVETMTVEAFLAAPDAPRLIGAHDPRPAAVSPETAQPVEAAAVRAPVQAAQVEPEIVTTTPIQPVEVAAVSGLLPATVAAAPAHPAAMRVPVQTAQAQPATVTAAQDRLATVTATSVQPERSPPAAPALPRKPQPVTAAHRQPTQTEDEQRRSAWANAMIHVAAEFATDPPNASPEERRVNKIRVNALSSVARTLLTGAPPQTFEFKLPNAPGSPPATKPRRR